MTKKEIVAFIPARGGSKGVPDKNIRLLANIPLIEHTIKASLDCEMITSTVVSTDSEKIAQIAEKAGATVPFMRPDYLSGDTCTTESAMMHFAEYCDKIQYAPDYIILLQATSPLRYKDSLKRAINFLHEGAFDSVLSVSATHRFFWQNKTQPSASYDFMNRPRRQDIKEHDRYFMETGSIYISDFKQFKKHKNRLFGNIGLFETSELESFEIDTELDFAICEKLIERLSSQ